MLNPIINTSILQSITDMAGQVIVRDVSAIDPEGGTLTYEWLINGIPIVGQNSPRLVYTLKASDDNKIFSVRVTSDLSELSTALAAEETIDVIPSDWLANEDFRIFWNTEITEYATFDVDYIIRAQEVRPFEGVCVNPNGCDVVVFAIARVVKVDHNYGFYGCQLLEGSISSRSPLEGEEPREIDIDSLSMLTDWVRQGYAGSDISKQGKMNSLFLSDLDDSITFLAGVNSASFENKTRLKIGSLSGLTENTQEGLPKYGIIGFKGNTSQEVFRIDDDSALISTWNFDNDALWSDNKGINWDRRLFLGKNHRGEIGITLHDFYNGDGDYRYDEDNFVLAYDPNSKVVRAALYNLNIATPAVYSMSFTYNEEEGLPEDDITWSTGQAAFIPPGVSSRLISIGVPIRLNVSFNTTAGDIGNQNKARVRATAYLKFSPIDGGASSIHELDFEDLEAVYGSNFEDEVSINGFIQELDPQGGHVQIGVKWTLEYSKEVRSLTVNVINKTASVFLDTVSTSVFSGNLVTNPFNQKLNTTNNVQFTSVFLSNDLEDGDPINYGLAASRKWVKENPNNLHQISTAGNITTNVLHVGGILSTGDLTSTSHLNIGGNAKISGTGSGDIYIGTSTNANGKVGIYNDSGSICLQSRFDGSRDYRVALSASDVAFLPSSSGSDARDKISLGTSSYRWKDLYLGGNIGFYNTGDQPPHFRRENVATFVSNNSVETGTFKIDLGRSWGSTMQTFEVEIYEFQSSICNTTLKFSGYDYNHAVTKRWFNYEDAVQIGGGNRRYGVTLTHDGTNCCILIYAEGNLSTHNTQWEYPRIVLKSWEGHYSTNVKNRLSDNVTISLITDTTGYSDFYTPKISAYGTTAYVSDRMGIGINPEYPLDVNGVARFQFKTNSYYNSSDEKSRLYFFENAQSLYRSGKDTGTLHEWRNASNYTNLTLSASALYAPDATTHLGTSGARWINLYLSGDANVAGNIRSNSIGVFNDDVDGNHIYIGGDTSTNNGAIYQNNALYLQDRHSNSQDYRLVFNSEIEAFSPSSSGSDARGKISLGTVNNTWKELWLSGNANIGGSLTVNGNTSISGFVGSPSYVSGFTGEGWRIDNTAKAEFSSLSVRGLFRVNELEVNKIRSTNGSLFVTDSIVIDELYRGVHEGQEYCNISQDGENVPFKVNDIIMCQVWDSTNNSIKRIVQRVSYINTREEFHYATLYKYDTLEGSLDDLKEGDTIVRIGSTTDTNRQGLLYLTSSDSNSPYLDVLDGVTSNSFVGKTKVRLGKLDGITDPTFGALTGYGLYADNAYLKGKIVSKAGLIGGWNISERSISKSFYSGSTTTLGDNSEHWEGTSVRGFQVQKDNLTKRIYIGETPIGIELAYYNQSLGGDGWAFRLGDNGNKIGKFNFDTGRLTYSVDSNKVWLGQDYSNSSYNGFGIYKDNDNYVRMIQANAGSYLQLKKDGVNIINLNTVETSKIGGWNLSNTGFWAGSKHGQESTGGVELQINRVLVHKDYDNYVNLYRYNNDDWGMLGKTDLGIVFQLGSTNKIAGWNFTNSKLYSGNIELASNGSIRHTSDKWRFNNDGSGQIAGGGIRFDANSKMQIIGTFGGHVGNLINWRYYWTKGASEATNFIRYGDSNENEIIPITTPYGTTDLAWEVRTNSSTANGYDGGYYTSYFPVQCNQIMRYAVWMYQSSTNGSIYHGLRGIVSKVDGTSDSNPYFLPGGDLPQMNRWYLVVGYLRPKEHRLVESPGVMGAMYDTNGEKVKDCIDFYFTQDADETYDISVRNLWYDSSDPSTSALFYNPIVEICDGSEQSIESLINGSSKSLGDTIFTNGFIKTELIEAGSITTDKLSAESAVVENIITRNLKTADSGERLEITDAQKGMTMYGADGAMSMKVTGKDLTTMTSSSGNFTVIDVPSTTKTGYTSTSYNHDLSGNISIAYSNNIITIPSFKLSMRAATIFSNNVPSSAKTTLRISIYFGGVYVYSRTVTNTSITNQTIPTIKISSPTGTKKLTMVAEATYYLPQILGTNTGSVTYAVDFTGNGVREYTNRYFEIAKNGIRFSSSNLEQLEIKRNTLGAISLRMVGIDVYRENVAQPYIFASGEVDGDGKLSQYTGEHMLTSRVTTGLYRIQHDLGHSRYMVVAIGRRPVNKGSYQTSKASVGYQDNSIVEVTVADDSTAGANHGFTFQIWVWGILNS